MIDTPHVRRLIRLAIEEDLATGDLTTELTVSPIRRGRAELVAKEELVVCGLPILPLLFRELGFAVKLSLISQEGDLVKSGKIFARLSGRVAELLSLERIALNFMQHLSGIATHTRHTVKRAGSLTVLDTRKTTPGFRLLDKYAVRVGGAKNHRFSLGDMILIKNNHIDASGGNLKRLLQRVYRDKPPYIPVEVEVRDRKELREALAFSPDIIMLDNMNDSQVKQAVRDVAAVSPHTMVEVSGRVDAKRVQSLKSLNVSFASMGALTNRASSVDISMRIR